MTIERNTLAEKIEDFDIYASCMPCNRHPKIDVVKLDQDNPGVGIMGMSLIGLARLLRCDQCRNKDIQVFQSFKSKGSIPKDWNGNI